MQREGLNNRNQRRSRLLFAKGMISKPLILLFILSRQRAKTGSLLVYCQPLKADIKVGRHISPVKEGGVDEKRIAFRQRAILAIAFVSLEAKAFLGKKKDEGFPVAKIVDRAIMDLKRKEG